MSLGVESVSAQSVERVLSGESPPSYTSTLLDDQLLKLGMFHSQSARVCCVALGWLWYQPGGLPGTCTSLQTDNHASTSTLSFYGLGDLSGGQPAVSKH